MLLQDLYRGNLTPIEQFQPITEEYKEQRKKQYREYEECKKKLKALDTSLLLDFQELYDQLYFDIPFEQESVFVYGFRIGARIMLEIMEEKVP